MTWTVFEHNHGDNETDDHAPGRGGYKYVLVPLSVTEAVEWWENEHETDPTRQEMPYPESDVDDAWLIEEYEDPEAVREHCGEMELDQGAIGVPMRRHYTWSELNGRLDVRVVTAEDIDL